MGEEKQQEGEEEGEEGRKEDEDMVSMSKEFKSANNKDIRNKEQGKERESEGTAPCSIARVVWPCLRGKVSQTFFL